ncbi:MAG TPA: hypothetical protein VJA17_04530 [Candidatus Omnitrophota bacterium]|nr:hypothetical protein [Candidatus Omnitrophota bacterium]
MFKFLRKIKGQSTLEYAVLIIIIIGALLSIQAYIKRGVQGRLKQATDDVGEQFSVGNQNSLRNVHSKSTTRDTFMNGQSESAIIGDEIVNVTSFSNIINVQQEYWGKQQVNQ